MNLWIGIQLFKNSINILLIDEKIKIKTKNGNLYKILSKISVNTPPPCKSNILNQFDYIMYMDFKLLILKLSLEIFQSKLHNSGTVNYLQCLLCTYTTVRFSQGFIYFL